LKESAFFTFTYAHASKSVENRRFPRIGHPSDEHRDAIFGTFQRAIGKFWARERNERRRNKFKFAASI